MPWAILAWELFIKHTKVFILVGSASPIPDNPMLNAY